MTIDKELTGAEIVLEALKDQEVDTIFGYPGGAVLPIYDALFGQNFLKHVLVRQEGGAVHAGWLRANGGHQPHRPLRPRTAAPTRALQGRRAALGGDRLGRARPDQWRRQARRPGEVGQPGRPLRPREGQG